MEAPEGRYTDFRCPHCRSEDTQSVQVLLAMGTQHGKTRGSAVGIGVGGGGLGIGIASTNANTTTVSALASRFRLPRRPTLSIAGIFLSFVFAVPSIMFGVIGISHCILKLKDMESAAPALIMICGTIGFGLWFMALGMKDYSSQKKRLPARQEEWKERKRYLENAWFCYRCGTEWCPPGLRSS